MNGGEPRISRQARTANYSVRSLNLVFHINHTPSTRPRVRACIVERLVWDYALRTWPILIVDDDDGGGGGVAAVAVDTEAVSAGMRIQDGERVRHTYPCPAVDTWCLARDVY